MELLTLGGNWVDLVVILAIGFFIFSSRGFLYSLIELSGFLLAIMLAYNTYTFLGTFIIMNFSLPNGISHALGFFAAWFFFEAVIYTILLFIVNKHIKEIPNPNINRVLGSFAAAAHALIICIFIVAIIFTFPVKGWIKEDILESQTGPVFVNFAQNLEKRINLVFGDAVNETINFLTVKPTSQSTVELDFTIDPKKATIDAESERLMLSMVNNERTKRGFGRLTLDTDLRHVAREYAREMLEHGFFSHVSVVDSSSAAQRVSRNGIDYMVVGENLAYAPDVYIAHNGLMNSEGHRKNILLSDYGRVGIGVIDAGVYGKMFVQVFAD